MQDLIWSHIQNLGLGVYHNYLLPSFSILKNTIRSYQRDKVHRMGAALSYYTLFSLPALIIIVVSLVGFFLGEAAVRGEIYDFLEKKIFNNDKEAARQIEKAIRSIVAGSTNWWATALGFGFLIFVASNIFYAIQETLNRIFQMEKISLKVHILEVFVNRLLSFGMILSIGVLLFLSTFANTLLLTITDFVMNQKGSLETSLTFLAPYLNYFTSYFLIFLNSGVSIVLIACFFGALYKILPAAKLQNKHIIYGALFAAVLFWVGELLIGLYLSRAWVVSVYGTAGSLIVLLIWVYYSAQLVFLGAEFIKSYCEYKEAEIKPKRFAQRLQNLKLKRKAKQ